MQLAEKLRSNFAKNLTMLREGKHLTQVGLANALNEQYQIGLKRASIANYESEEAMPKIDALYCIADYFGKTIDQLLHERLERPVLIHPWMLKDPSAVAANTGAALSTFNPETTANLNAVLNDYADAIANRQFYVEFFRTLLQQFQLHATQLNDQEKINHLFKRTYLSCLISKSKWLNDKAAAVLEETEYKVWMGFREGSSAQMLSEALQMTEEAVLNTFYAAKNKIVSAIDNISASP